MSFMTGGKDSSDDANQKKQADRFLKLHQEDAEFRGALALNAVNEAKTRPGLRLAEVVKIVMEGYAERPALGQRAREYVTDAASGRTTRRLLPGFETISYAELWDRARRLAADLHGNERDSFKAGDFLCVLGFASIDYCTHILAGIHLGATMVPLQTNAPATNHVAIIEETGARILAVGIDYVDKAVDAALASPMLSRLVVFDYEAQDDDQREAFEAARLKLGDASSPIVVEALDSVVERGQSLPEPPLYVPAVDEDPLAWLFYTSGTTGTPKGAMFTQSLVINTWLLQMPLPAITLSFMPMSHLVGNGFMLLALSCGGISYCSPKSDLSTLFEDLSLVRPTMASLVPRVCEMLYQHYLREVDLRLAGGGNEVAIGDTVKCEMREQLLGGRLFSVGSGSAALSPEIRMFMESMLDMPMPIGYSCTEIGGGTILVDGQVQRPLVVAYKLDDVPELGYFRTDKPHPRGELLLKTSHFMDGYFKRPELTAERFDEEGYYRTGDVMAELGPDHLEFVDRRNNVIKLSQGEFVAVARLEALYSESELIKQIYIYGTSERAFLLAVVVPTDEPLARLQAGGAEAERVKAEIRQSMQKIAEEQMVASYEIPRDFILETEVFSQRNGLLSEIGKHLRPKLRERYADALETLYAEIAQGQVDELRSLRASGRDQPVLDTVIRALKASLGLATVNVQAEDRFGDLGGDSLTALEFSMLLEEIFDIEVPVGVIIDPTGNARLVAQYIERERDADSRRATAARIHGRDFATVAARDLKLDRFITPELIGGATALPLAESNRAVLLTGATGYLGRFLALSWLEQLAQTGGTLVLVARAADASDARQRIAGAFDTDPELVAHFRELADAHLEVLAGDLGAPDLGLDKIVWNRLAETVDVVVHCGAHVNHVLPYKQLFAPNVAGTAELIRLSITARRKCFHYISTLGVSMLCKGGLVDETSDIREMAPTCEVGDGYANGYNISKWASEVLLREAFENCSLPVSVFRPGMILAHSRYAGQLNVPDMFTRLLFSLASTGVAPATFYARDLSTGRPKGRYDGFAVDFLANAITAIGMRDKQGFHAYNTASPHSTGASLDDFVDWMIDDGCDIERVDNYDEWLSRFETAMHALPEKQQQHSLLALLGPYRQPQVAIAESPLQCDRFCESAAAAGFEVPQISSVLIRKYIDDLRHLNYL